LNAPRRYSLPEPLLQAVVSELNELPARRVRGLLNALEMECMQQDQAAEAAPVQAPGRRARSAKEGAAR